MNNQSMTFKTPAQGQFVMAVYIIIITVFVIFIARASEVNISWLIFVVLGVFAYVTSMARVSLVGDALVVKSPLGKGRVYPLSSGAFEMQKVTGVKAHISYFKKEADSIIYTPTGSDRSVLVMNGLYHPEDVKAMFAAIEARQKNLKS
ncbi:hypothetical protein B9T21_01285 [Wohlfahrtiimonas chitiniclastica]|uniref:hypothetical protein n=1 Tax=Wohlfahrtiimonas chitiniclastica TaxID=400946 RepID=UPI000B98A698|nr:hypothetical protein [Wohlfahrtiimonas chitiniclastica]OYQ89406.1 hypothetical protein B9T21_01285 [Wohlfahrtiimonas chitiniclastica]